MRPAGCGLTRTDARLGHRGEAEGMRLTVEVSDDAIAIGESTDVTITVTNEGDEPITGSWSRLLKCSQDVTTTVTDEAGATLPPAADATEWDGNPDTLPMLVNVDPPELFWSAPTEPRGAPRGLYWHASPRRARARRVRLRHRYVERVVLTRARHAPTRPRAHGGGSVLPRLRARTDRRRRSHQPRLVPPTRWLVRRPVPHRADRDDVQAILDEFGPNEQAPPDPPTYGVFLVQVGEDFLLRIHGDNGAADIWFNGTYGMGDEFGPTKFEHSEVIDVQRLTSGDVIDSPNDGVDPNQPEETGPTAPGSTTPGAPAPPTTALVE